MSSGPVHLISGAKEPQLSGVLSHGSLDGNEVSEGSQVSVTDSWNRSADLQAGLGGDPLENVVRADEAQDTIKGPPALWEKPFIPFLTAPHNFCVDEDTTVKVPTMLQDTQHHWYLHDREDGAGGRGFDSQDANKMEQLAPEESFHKAVLEVDEVGTQAAGATSSFVTFWPWDNHQALWFNQLFLVVIFSTNAQSIFFLGKVVNPTKP
ncbi:hypothetical protein JEQ12_008020 [Ovis aries]|uniref:Serpin domain-containing protein n=1 Tax=Ovis aries TaxID=9940 RepID=A0A835ZPH9_SHEEP|nr:hypothetical protein JEQ12_008020 [Ovis aries]